MTPYRVVLANTLFHATLPGVVISARRNPDAWTFGISVGPDEHVPPDLALDSVEIDGASVAFRRVDLVRADDRAFTARFSTGAGVSVDVAVESPGTIVLVRIAAEEPTVAGRFALAFRRAAAETTNSPFSVTTDDGHVEGETGTRYVPETSPRRIEGGAPLATGWVLGECTLAMGSDAGATPR